MERDLIDVTSNHRPDTSWRFTDAKGHEHRWYVGWTPAESYSPMVHYEVPTVVWVSDGTRYDEDGEPYEVGHVECRECGEHVKPGHTADAYEQKVAGLLRCYVDDRPVTREEFERLAREDGIQL
jgi:hypothetical protein